jgi:phosphonopyruvate decarboxylase
MNRREAIERILDQVDDQDIIVSSTGMTSRELYNIEDRPLNFYMMGSMGNALAIGLGVALNTDRKVHVINGDASALMSLGTMVTHKKLNPANLYHYILDNNCHASTGLVNK